MTGLAHGVWLVTLVSTVVTSPDFSNFLPSAHVARCDRLVSEVSKSEERVRADLPPNILGHWVSQRCETRPGPEFLLRSYRFHRNHTFTMLQFHYDDPSCTVPLYSLAAHGQLDYSGKSWITPGAMDADYTLFGITVTAYNNDMAARLSQGVNDSCPGRVNRPWKTHREYRFDDRIDVRSDIDCLAFLHFTANELQLIRVEERAAGRHGNDFVRRELLLGDLPLEVRLRQQYRPTAYQIPLLHTETLKSCHICRIVAKSRQRSPPHLMAVAGLPPYLAGEWVSRRCETRPYGTFLTRRIRFLDDNSWQGLFQFYRDPRCLLPLFSLVGRGKVIRGRASDTLSGAVEYDFETEALLITPQDSGMVNNLNGFKEDVCGSAGSWRLDEPQDVTPTEGCSGMGLKVPAWNKDIIRLELDNNGNPLLLLGQRELGGMSSGRPTSFQAPLAQCRVYADLTDDNEIVPVLHPVLDARVSSAPHRHCAVSVPFMLLFVMHFIYIT